MNYYAAIRNTLRQWLPALLMAGTSLTAQAGALYVTDIDRNITDPTQNAYGVSLVQVGGDGKAFVAERWRHGPLLGGESGFVARAPIAVLNGRVNVAGPFNHNYALDGSDQQSSICLGSLCNSIGAASDGATDGSHNYTIAPTSIGSASQGIWRADLDWGQGGLLFSLSMLNAGEVANGITYDPTHGALWVDAWSNTTSSGRVLELGLDGTVISSFDRSGIGSSVLAMDYADGSLWLMQYGDLLQGQNVVNSILRFDLDGTLLSSIAYGDDWLNRPVYGAEFELEVQSVPEPSGLALVVLALGAVLAARRFAQGLSRFA